MNNDTNNLLRMADTVLRHGLTPALWQQSLLGMREAAPVETPVVFLRAAREIPPEVTTPADLAAFLRQLAGGQAHV